MGLDDFVLAIELWISEGREKQPISLVVSNQAIHPSIWPFFQQPVQRWLLQNTDVLNKNLVPNGYHQKINLSENWFKSLKLLSNKTHLVYTGVSILS